MTLADALIASGAGSALTLAVQHFWPKGGLHVPDAAKVETTLSGFGQVLTHGEQSVLSFLTDMETRYMAKIDDALANYSAKRDAQQAAAVAAAVAAAEPSADALSAAKAEQEDADAAVVQNAADAIQLAPAE